MKIFPHRAFEACYPSMASEICANHGLQLDYKNTRKKLLAPSKRAPPHDHNRVQTNMSYFVSDLPRAKATSTALT